MEQQLPWLALALALALARFGAELAQRYSLPSVLGELGAGILLGNLGLLGFAPLAHASDVLAHDPHIAFLAELGAVVLLFQVGIESDVKQLLASGWAATRVAISGVVAPLALGYLGLALLRPESDAMQRLFVGSVLCATSVGITARVLRDLGRLASSEARIILGAAVIDDVLGLLVLALVLGLARTGSPDAWAIARLIGLSVAFLGGGVVVGRLAARWLLGAAARGRTPGRSLSVALALCFVFSWGAHAVGLAPIVGAFAAGLLLDPVFEVSLRERGEEGIAQGVESLGIFLVPLFFVKMGAACNLASLDVGALGLAAALTLAAVLGKLVTSLFIGPGDGKLDRWAVGLGMIPRGEVGLIVAFQGTLVLDGGRPLVDASTFAALVLVVLATTLMTPPLLAWRLRGKPVAAPTEAPRAGV